MNMDREKRTMEEMDKDEFFEIKDTQKHLGVLFDSWARWHIRRKQPTQLLKALIYAVFMNLRNQVVVVR